MEVFKNITCDTVHAIGKKIHHRVLAGGKNYFIGFKSRCGAASYIFDEVCDDEDFYPMWEDGEPTCKRCISITSKSITSK